MQRIAFTKESEDDAWASRAPHLPASAVMRSTCTRTPALGMIPQVKGPPQWLPLEKHRDTAEHDSKLAACTELRLCMGVCNSNDVPCRLSPNFRKSNQNRGSQRPLGPHHEAQLCIEDK